MDARLRWTERTRELVARCGVFDLYRSHRAAPDGREGDFHVLEAPDWVNVVPVVNDPARGRCFLMVRQHRHGADLVTTEFPAGLVEPGEDPREAAERELAEETGRRAGRMTVIGRVAPNPAFMTNWCTTFLAEDLAPAPGAAQDALELLETRMVPERELFERAGTGEYVNSLVVVALAWFLRREGAPA
ncbi:MAG: NUDIX hydrolase [Spirochaetes bacterium]|nr:NUDIX hydrolase [Spirochaetota bacterium]